MRSARRRRIKMSTLKRRGIEQYDVLSTFHFSASRPFTFLDHHVANIQTVIRDDMHIDTFVASSCDKNVANSATCRSRG